MMQLTRLNVPQGECVLRRARLAIALSLGLLLSSTLFAQRYSCRNYSHEEGLNDLNIVCLLQDHAGLIRVAHFTGVRPGNYNFEVSSGLRGEGWQSVVASAPIHVDGPFWTGRNLWIGLVALVGALFIAAWRTRERIHRRRQTELAVAVDERTEEIARQRILDQQRNQILEMLVSNQPLGIILNRVLQILVRETPGTMCLILLRSGDTCRVASAAGLPEDWVASFQIPRALPFESWHKESCWSHPSDHPAWGLFHSRLSGPGPAHLHSWPLLIGDVPVGALVQCWPPGAAVDHATIYRALAGSAGTPQMVLQLTSLAMEHNRLYEDLEFRVRHDALTGLGNRVLFEERLDRALKESRALGQKLGVVYIDLDFFKAVNDRFSHRVGDLYLCAIADRMRAALRPVDVLARIGGDEFTVLIPNVLDTDDAARLAERVLTAIQQPLSISGHEFHPGASAGVAVYPDDGFDADQLQRFADAAMYHAKNSGRNRVQLFTPSREVPLRAGLEQDLRTALREEQFVLYYQPKIGRRNQFMGFEALLRLNHPGYGLVPPLEFIPAAERHGLIIPIGAWVVEEVCRQMAGWRDDGYGDIPVAINVSAIQMSQPDFANSVIGCLSRHNIAPRYFELELTESILVTGSEIALSQMRQLRSTGIRLSIDDFGTGYSSLSYLHRLEVDTVKLDKSFVKSIEDDQMGRWLVKATIGIAQGLGLDVIAEGVETDAQRSALLVAGCHVMQGYLFSHPAPPSELEHWLRRPVDVRKMIAS